MVSATPFQMLWMYAVVNRVQHVRFSFRKIVQSKRFFWVTCVSRAVIAFLQPDLITSPKK